MDDWSYPYPDDPPDWQPTLLDQDRRVMEARRARAQRAGAAHVAELLRAHAVDGVGNHVEADVTLPFAAPPGAALNF